MLQFVVLKGKLNISAEHEHNEIEGCSYCQYKNPYNYVEIIKLFSTEQ
jgi:hypothetical protein